MGFFSLMDRHAGLVGRMADALDIDLAASAQRGEFPEEGFRSVVYACTSCSRPGDCAEWLDDHADGAETTPAYCRNKVLFDRLK